MAGGELVPLGALHGIGGDRGGFLEGHPPPPIGIKAAPKDGLRGGRICTYVSSIKGDNMCAALANGDMTLAP